MSRITYIGVALILSSLANAAGAADRPAGFTALCSRDSSCTLQTTANVAFGRDNRFTYKVLSGSFVCNAETFDSAAHADGECSIPSKLLRTPARRSNAVNYGNPRGTADSSS